jgi:hypothetical protein
MEERKWSRYRSTRVMRRMVKECNKTEQGRTRKAKMRKKEIEERKVCKIV